MKTGKKMIFGQPSWRIASSTVEAYVTELGGHLAPVTFTLANGQKVQPYSIAPWATETLDPKLDLVLRPLRGDFFCLPFGGNSEAFRGEKHPPHGETASVKWKLEDLERAAPVTGMHLSLRTHVRKGRVDKIIAVVDGDAAVYSRHVVSGMSGPMCLAHHAMLKFPDEPGCGVVSTSPLLFGQVFDEPTERPEHRGYSLLKPGAVFTSLTKVPTITGEMTDLSHYPARRGFEDIVLLAGKPDVPLAWTAVTFPKKGTSGGYVWFALKDPRVLRSTMLWLSNGGRHYAPWNGRHVNVLGLEELTGYFHRGLAASARPNPLSKQGIATCVQLDPKRPLLVNYIQAMAAIPPGFDRVARIEPENDQLVTLVAASGKRAQAHVDLNFLRDVTAQ